MTKQMPMPGIMGSNTSTCVPDNTYLQVLKGVAGSNGCLGQRYQHGAGQVPASAAGISRVVTGAGACTCGAAIKKSTQAEGLMVMLLQPARIVDYSPANTGHTELKLLGLQLLSVVQAQGHDQHFAARYVRVA